MLEWVMKNCKQAIKGKILYWLCAFIPTADTLLLMLVLNICTIYCIYNRVDLAVTSETGAQAPSLPLS